MKGKILFSSYNKDEGITLVCKATKYGTFWSETQVSEADTDVANRWTGGRLAEYKCDLQALKKKCQIMNERANGVEHALRVIVDGNYNNFSERDWTIIKKLERQANIARRDADNLREAYKNLVSGYKVYADSEINAKRDVKNMMNKPAE